MQIEKLICERRSVKDVALIFLKGKVSVGYDFILQMDGYIQNFVYVRNVMKRLLKDVQKREMIMDKGIRKGVPQKYPSIRSNKRVSKKERFMIKEIPTFTSSKGAQSV